MCAQQVVAEDIALARRLVSAGSLHEYAAGKTIVRQGDANNDIYLILSGSVGIVINDREIAIRSSGTHVGEMALLDTTARRSATLLTREKTVVIKVSEADVTRIARIYPEFWRRLALVLADRLRERTKFIKEPNSVPIAFIGSSSKAVTCATYIRRALERSNITCRLWTEGVFQLSRTTIEDLIRVSGECDFAVLLLTPDDMTASKGKKKASPRDNVVFELGLFMGAIGRDRTYIVVPEGADLKLPTDLLGITHASYVRGHRVSIGDSLRKALSLVRQRIKSLGPK
jgi:CRP/FNR family transcriptional regulator, cyclic AMP receptor protein